MAEPMSMQEEAATRQIWAAVMLSHDVDVAISILRGEKVLVRQLDRAALRRALRGAPLPADDEYIEVTIHMLAAINEGGPFEIKENKLALREPRRKKDS